jgi:hypothetical protein
MSDIAKCRDAHCPSKLICERYTATDSVVWQSYVNFNREDDAYNCEMFVHNGTCKYCGLDNDNHKLSCPVIKVTMLL